MTATPDTKQATLDAVRESHPAWPYAPDHDTVNGDPWPLAWDAAAFIEEWFEHPEHDDVEDAIAHLELDASQFGYDVTDWHSKQPPEALLKAHILRIVKGWSGETALHDYLTEQPKFVVALGFEDKPASKTTLWRVWNKGRLTPEHKQVLRTIGQVIVNIAREHSVPAPDEVFHPNPTVDAPEAVEQDDGTVRDRTIGKTREIWKRSKPLITDNYHLPRAANTEIHENAFWEGHAFVGSREEMYVENGTWNFAAETTRDRVQTGSTHRHHVQKIGPDQAREMHRGTTQDLIEKAKRKAGIRGGVTVAIDITKSNPYRTKTKLETDGQGNVTNPWLLGYKDDDEDTSAEFYFQWASIQVVEFDLPIILDAIPVYRGLSRADIVDRLLETATNMVDVELLLMDREFAHDAVKDTCDDHNVWYLNPGVMHTSERATCTRLRQAGELVHVERDESPNSKSQRERRTLSDFVGDNQDDEEEEGLVRKKVYVPAMNADRTPDEPDEDESESELATDEDADDGDKLRQELLDEFKETTESDTEEMQEMFDDVLDEVREEEAERDLPGNEEDMQLYMLFESNHPDIDIPNEDDESSEREQAHMVSRVLRIYNQRWIIENGFKQIKSFRVRTTSMDHEYRFFNFLYACTLYNVWRLTDILVKLELDAKAEFEDKPLVSADLFLTIAKDYRIIGLDPPD